MHVPCMHVPCMHVPCMHVPMWWPSPLVRMHVRMHARAYACTPVHACMRVCMHVRMHARGCMARRRSGARAHHSVAGVGRVVALRLVRQLREPSVSRPLALWLGKRPLPPATRILAPCSIKHISPVNVEPVVVVVISLLLEPLAFWSASPPRLPIVSVSSVGRRLEPTSPRRRGDPTSPRRRGDPTSPRLRLCRQRLHRRLPSPVCSGRGRRWGWRAGGRWPRAARAMRRRRRRRRCRRRRVDDRSRAASRRPAAKRNVVVIVVVVGGGLGWSGLVWSGLGWAGLDLAWRGVAWFGLA